MAEKILIIKLWAIGEVALATSCVRRLKKEYPGCDIDFLVGDRAKDIVVGNPDIRKTVAVAEEVFLKPDPLRLLALIKDLRRERYDMAVTLHLYPLFSLFAYLIGAGQRLGMKRPGSWSLNTHDVISDYTIPKILNYLNIFRPLGFLISKDDARVAICPTEEDKRRISLLMDEFTLERKRFIVISPTGGENPAAARLKSNIVTKAWPAEYYKELSGLILKDLDYKVVIVGGEAERARASHIKRGHDGRLIDLTGKVNLRELALLAEACVIAITNDSGPMHIMASSGSPIVAIFGPTDHCQICAPSKNITILMEKLDCSPCFDETVFPNKVIDCKDPICMRSIRPEKVYRKLCEILKL